MLRATTTSVLLAMILGCPAGDDDDPTETQGGSEDGASATPTGSGESSGTPTTMPGTTTPGSGETAGSASGDVDSDGGSSGASGASCEPDPADDTCSVCTKESCCDQLDACFGVDACVCMTECATGLDSIAMCTKMCGTSMEFSALTTCVTLNCAADCI